MAPDAQRKLVARQPEWFAGEHAGEVVGEWVALDGWLRDRYHIRTRLRRRFAVARPRVFVARLQARCSGPE
jgi:hypothetical protein